MNSAFTIKESLSFAWKKMSENFWFLVLLTLGFFIVEALLNTGDGKSLVGVLSQILNAIVGVFASFTFINLSLKIHKGHKATWNDVVEFDLRSFYMYIFAACIVTIAQVLGFVLFIIPGVIIAVRFGLFAFPLIDHKLKPVAAIKKSIALTRGHFWHLFGLGIVLTLINILGAMAFVIGLLITVPFGILAMAHVYEKLKAAPVAVEASTPSSAQ